MSRRWAAKWFVAYLIVLFGLTLGGFYHPGAPVNLVLFRTMEHDIRKGGWEFLINFVGNVVVTLPIGWLLPTLFGRWASASKVGMFGLTISAFIEILQGISGKRVADVDNVILNTLGALIGYGTWVGVGWLLKSSRKPGPFSEEASCRVEFKTPK
jgi:glycopeptide antibiotics resistance protein